MRALLLDRRAQPVRNIHPRGNNPSLANGWGAQTPNGNTVTFPATDGPTGGPCMRVELTTAGQLRMQHNTPTAGLRIPVPASTLLTVAAWVYSPRALTQCSFETQFFNAAGTGLFIRGSEFSLAPGWQFVRSTVTSTSTAVSLGQCQVITQSNAGNTGVAGDVFRMARAMVVIGPYDGVYCDGGTPGWKWLGTPLLSESVGWPYTLDSVAGKPLGYLTTAGVSLDTGVLGKSFEPITFYAVTDKLSTTTNWTDFVSIGPNPSSGVNGDGIATTWMGGGGTGAQLRLDTSSVNGQGFNQFLAAQPVPVGRHLWTGQVSAGATLLGLGIDGAALAAKTALPGSGFSRRYMWMPSGLTSAAHQGFVAYSAEHNAATRLAIARWLANRYGTPLAV